MEFLSRFLKKEYSDISDFIDCSSIPNFYKTNIDGVDSPYLDWLKAFSNSNESSLFDVLINNNDLFVVDLLAIGYIYLPDDRLVELESSIKTRCRAENSLQNIIFCNTYSDVENVITDYVSSTGDVQTVTLAVASLRSSPLISNKNVIEYVNKYKDFLNALDFNSHCEELDLFINTINATNNPQKRQVSIACSYCGKSVFLPCSKLQRDSGRTDYNSIRCANCSNLSPLCCICQYPITYWPPQMDYGEGGNDPVVKRDGCKKGICWCNTCHHGGHAVHIIEWFRFNNVCAVKGCNCRCNDE